MKNLISSTREKQKWQVHAAFTQFLWKFSLHQISFYEEVIQVPSVLWHCWLGSRKGIPPVKKLEWWGAGVVNCLEQCADLHMAQLMPLPLTVSCFTKIEIGLTFLVPAHLGSPGQRAVKRVCVCVLFRQWQVTILLLKPRPAIFH